MNYVINQFVLFYIICILSSILCMLEIILFCNETWCLAIDVNGDSFISVVMSKTYFSLSNLEIFYLKIKCPFVTLFFSCAFAYICFWEYKFYYILTLLHSIKVNVSNLLTKSLQWFS